MSASTVDARAFDDHFNSPWPTIVLPSYPYTNNMAVDFGPNIQSEMSLVHNIFIRSLNSLHASAPLVASHPHDIPAFIGYALTAIGAIAQHHAAEEEVFFPAVRELGMQGMVEENIEGHEAFHVPMDEFVGYLTGVRDGRDVFDAEKTRTLLKAFADPLVKHLHDEIPTVRPEVMMKIDKDILQKIAKDLDEHVQAQGGFTTTVPFMLTGHNRVHAPSWPVIPGPIKWFALNVLSRINSSYWKFSPYNLSGEPQRYSP